MQVQSSVTLEETDNVDDFIEKLDRIELPGQLISFLSDPLLQKYLILNPSSISARRIDLWLAAYLEDEYETARRGQETSSQLSEILDAVLDLTRYTKASLALARSAYSYSSCIQSVLPIAAAFLKAYLPVWDGVTDDTAITGILSTLPFQPFSGVSTTWGSNND